MQQLITTTVAAIMLAGSYSAQATDWNYKSRRDLSAEGMRQFGVTEEKTERHVREVRLLNLSSGLNLLGDCGNLDFKVSAKAIYNEGRKMFTDLREAALGSAQGVINAAPMLALCYFSPTACSIAKNLQLYSSFRAKLKFDQCQAINSYMDSRAGAYREAQAQCVRSKMAQNGDVSSAVDACQGKAGQLLSWVDGSHDTSTSSNALVRSSAKWAGLPDEDGRFLESLLGGIELDTGGRTHLTFGGLEPLTAGRLFDSYAKTSWEKLCGEAGVLARFNDSRAVNDGDLAFFSSRGRRFVDRRIIASLAQLPAGEKAAACDRLSTALAETKFIDEIRNRIDQLYLMAQNPNLPANETQTLERKTDRLLTQATALLRLGRNRDLGLNDVRGAVLARANLEQERSLTRSAALGTALVKPDTAFADCEDFTLCGNQARR